MLGGLGKTGAIGSCLATALRPKGSCCVPVGFAVPRWVLPVGIVPYSYSGVRRYSYSVWAFSQRSGRIRVRVRVPPSWIRVPSASISNGATPGNHRGHSIIHTWHHRGHSIFRRVEGNSVYVGGPGENGDHWILPDDRSPPEGNHAVSPWGLLCPRWILPVGFSPLDSPPLDSPRWIRTPTRTQAFAGTRTRFGRFRSVQDAFEYEYEYRDAEYEYEVGVHFERPNSGEPSGTQHLSAR